MPSPRRSAVLARLAEQEADLLQGLCERIFARHLGRLIWDNRAGRSIGRSVLRETTTSRWEAWCRQKWSSHSGWRQRGLHGPGKHWSNLERTDQSGRLTSP